MPFTKNRIEHEGFVSEIDGDNIKVRFISVSACAACHAKGACSVSDMQDKDIEVFEKNHTFKIGEKVKVLLLESLGLRAVLIAYLYPFLIMLATLIVFSGFTTELQTGLLALSSVIIYFVIISLFKDKLRKTFTFKLEKII